MYEDRKEHGSAGMIDSVDRGEVVEGVLQSFACHSPSEEEEQPCQGEDDNPVHVQCVARLDMISKKIGVSSCGEPTFELASATK